VRKLKSAIEKDLALLCMAKWYFIKWKL